MPSPAITGPAVSSSGGEGKEISQPEPVKEIGLSVPQSEIRNIRIRTPEAEGKPAEISQPVYDTLVNTITFNLEILDEIPEAQRPAILKEFIDVFKAQNPGLKDMKDKVKVREAAVKFLSGDERKAVLAAFKVMEWEASLLHGASGARFEGKDPEIVSKDGETDIVFIDPKTGILTTQKVDSRNWWKRNVRIRNRNDVRGEKELKINTTLTTGVGSQITDASDIAYLDKCGWVNGTNIQTAANREILFKRLFSVAQARSELFSETGLTADEISKRLNFVDSSGRLKIAGREAHFIGEVSGGYTPAEFTSELHTIIDKIKTDTLEKLTKRKKESAEARVKDQIGKKIDDLKKGEIITPEEKEAEQRVIDQEIKEIKAKAELFTRNKLLTGEITEAQRALDEALRLVNEKQGNIALLPGETIDLLAWSDPSSPEYWGAHENAANILETRRAAINSEIESLQAEISSERSQRPSAEAVKRTITKTKDNSGVDVETIEEPDADVKAEFNASRTRVVALQIEVDNKRRSIDTIDIGSGMSLNQTIYELRSSADRRKQIVEGDAVTKGLLESYRDKERALKQKNDEQTDTNTRIAGVIIPPETPAEAEVRLREAIKKKEKEKESVGKASLDDQREISALSSIKEVITDPAKKAAMEQRLLDHEVGAYEDLEVSPELRDYPPVILQAIKLMFGPEALSSAGSTEDETSETVEDSPYKRAKALLESQWYVKIIIEQIENQNSATDRVAFAGSRTPGGQNQEITMANLKGLITGKSIDTLGKDEVSEATIRKIIDEIRKSALGYI